MEAFTYSVMGGVLRSDLEFPELPTIERKQCDWELRLESGVPPALDCVPLGQRELGAEFYNLARTPAGFRLEYSHAGCFDITHNGARIVWYPIPHAQRELARNIVLGPALALALESTGCLCLHGSAVAFANQAVGFIGAKRYGKSTLALALTTAGARLLSDDIIAIQPGPPALVRPGVASARLWEDTARVLDVENRFATVVRGVKTTVTAFEQSAEPGALCTLSALYVLDPVPPGTLASSCRRLRLQGTDAAVALAHQTKLADTLIGFSAAGDQLRAAVALASGVPVWNLTLARDFARLPAVTEQLLRWHSEPAS